MHTLQEIHPDRAPKVIQFLEAISIQHMGKLNAALSVGWSPRDLRELMKDPQFVELMDEARERGIETIEQKVYELAERGNLAAATLVLYCQASERGWRPPAQRVAVSAQSTVRVELVEGAKAAVMERLQRGDIKSLQPGGSLDVIDAEVVEDGSD